MTRLSRRPAELAAAQQMKMEMEDGLARARAVIEKRAVTCEEIALAGELRGNQMQLADQRLILGRRFVERNKMFSRAKQNMRWRLRADVLKRKDFGILVNDFRRNLFCRNFAEQAISAHQFPPVGASSSRRTTNGVNPSRSRSLSPNCRAASSPDTFPTRTR